MELKTSSQIIEEGKQKIKALQSNQGTNTGEINLWDIVAELPLPTPLQDPLSTPDGRGAFVSGVLAGKADALHGKDYDEEIGEDITDVTLRYPARRGYHHGWKLGS